MPLTYSALRAEVQWILQKTTPGFPPIKTDVVQSVKLEPVPSAFDQVYAVQHAIDPAASVTVDLSTFTNQLGEAVTADAICGLLVVPAGTGMVARVEPGDTHPLAWFLSGTAPAVSVPAGGVWLFVQPAPGQAIDATHRTLKVTNTGASAGTVTVVAIVSD